MHTGIPVTAWAAETDEILETAFDLLSERADKDGK